MRKILSLVLAVVMAFGSFSFAATTTAGVDYKAVGNELKVLGVIAGQDGGELNELGKLTREQALVVLSRMMGKEAEAKATTAESGYTDIPAGNFYGPYVSYAKLQGWTNGISETEFGFEKAATTKMVVTFMMRALGYEADWAKEDVITKAKGMGLLKDVSAAADDEIVRGEVFVLLRNTLNTNPKGANKALMYVLGLKGSATSTTLEVVSVYANNLKQIFVEFNQEVDKDSLKNAFTVKGSSLGGIEVDLLEDGKTAELTVGTNLINRRGYSIVIKNAKSVSGVKLEKVTKEFRAEDLEVPSIVEKVVTGPKSFNLVFSEPIKTLGTVKYNEPGKTARRASVKASKSYNNVVEVTGVTLVDGKTYEILAQGFRDYANYANLDHFHTLEYAKVTDAPQVKSISGTEKYVEVEFNRPVKGLSVKNFYHTYSAWTALGVYANKDDMDKGTKQITTSDKVEKVVVLFATKLDANKSNYPLQAGDVRVTLLGQVGARKVVDNWGNQLTDQDHVIAITADREAPVVELVEVTGDKEVTFTFNEKIQDVKASDVKLVKEDGSNYPGVYLRVKTEGKKLIVTVNKDLKDKTVVFNIKNIKDTSLAQNRMSGTESYTVTFTDKSFDGIAQAVQSKDKTTGSVFVDIEFKEAVDSEGAENIKNYRFALTETTTSGNIAFANANFKLFDEADASMRTDKIVRIEFDKDYAAKVFKNGAYKFAMVQINDEVKDLAGNSVKAFSNTADVKQMADRFSAKKAVAKDNITIEFKFDQDVELAPDKDLKVENFEVAGYKVEAVEFTDDADVIRIILDDKKVLPADPTSVTASYVGTSLVNALGGKASANQTVNLTDEIAPNFASKVLEKDGEAVKYATVKATTTSGIYTMTVKFNEGMDRERFSANTLVLEGVQGEAKIVAVDKPATDKDTIVFTVDVKDGDDTDAVVAAFADAVKNKEYAGEDTTLGQSMYKVGWTIYPAREDTIFDTHENALVGTDAIPVFYVK